MNIQVAYYSKSGHTKAVAEAIAGELGVNATSVEHTVINDTVDMLFIGAAIYAAGLSGNIKKFLDGLDASKVKEVVVFSTSAMVKRAHPLIKKRLEKSGIKVSDRNFYCKGNPNEEALQQARKFVREIVGE